MNLDEARKALQAAESLLDAVYDKDTRNDGDQMRYIVSDARSIVDRLEIFLRAKEAAALHEMKRVESKV